MPRHRKRKTDRKVQEERILRVRGVRRGSPDARKLSRAFIGLALARAEAEAQSQEEETKRKNKDGNPVQGSGGTQDGSQ